MYTKNFIYAMFGYPAHAYSASKTWGLKWMKHVSGRMH